MMGRATILLALLLGGTGAGTGTAGAQSAEHATLPDRLSLEYTISRAPLFRGVSQHTLQRHGDRWVVEARFHPKGLLRALVRSHEQYERSEFRISDGAIQVLRYHTRRDGRKTHNRTMVFDHEAALARFTGSGRSLPLPPGTMVVDYAMLPFLFMVNDPATLAGHSFLLSNGKSLAPYHSERVRRQTLDTALGKLDTWAITMQHSRRDLRSFTMWVAPAYDNVMVRLSRERGGKKTTFKLKAPPAR